MAMIKKRKIEEEQKKLELHAEFDDFDTFSKCLKQYNWDSDTQYSTKDSRLFEVRSTDENKGKKDEEERKQRDFKYSEIHYICKHKIGMKPENERCPSEIKLKYDKYKDKLVIIELNLNHECQTRSDSEKNSSDAENLSGKTEDSPLDSPVLKEPERQVSFLVKPGIASEGKGDDSMSLADRLKKVETSSFDTENHSDKTSPLIEDAEYSDQSICFQNSSFDSSMVANVISPKRFEEKIPVTEQRLDAIKMPVVIPKSSRRQRAIGLSSKSRIEQPCGKKIIAEDPEQMSEPTTFQELPLSVKKKLLLRKLLDKGVAKKACLQKYKVKKEDINFDRLAYTFRNKDIKLNILEGYLNKNILKALERVVAGQRTSDRWLCGQCQKSRNTSMAFPVICDQCLDQYHNTCVGLAEEPNPMSSWFCPDCSTMRLF